MIASATSARQRARHQTSDQRATSDQTPDASAPALAPLSARQAAQALRAIAAGRLSIRRSDEGWILLDGPMAIDLSDRPDDLLATVYFAFC